MKPLFTLIASALLLAAPVFTAYASAEEVTAVLPLKWEDVAAGPNYTIRKQTFVDNYRLTFQRYESKGAPFDTLTIQAKGARGSACSTTAASATPVIVLRCGNPQESYRLTRVGTTLTVEQLSEDNATIVDPPKAKVRS